jgi:hypothetical protein
MPCEDMPSRRSWSWYATTREVPPVVAVVAAILTGVVAAAFGQPAGQSVVMALLVGAGTVVAMYAFNYIRAPGEIARDQERRLSEWRDRYTIGVQQYAATPGEVDVRVTADRGPDLSNLWCEVEHGSRRFEARRPVPAGPGLEMGAGQWVVWWTYPQSFAGEVLERGLYRATVRMGEHVEPVGSAEWQI